MSADVSQPGLNVLVGELELAELATEQGGLVSRQQARDHLTPKQLERRLASGRLVAVRRGVYRFPGTPSGHWQDLRAACLAAGPAAVASHHSAAELWGFRGMVAGQPEITVPSPMWPRLPGVRCHQSSRLPASRVATRFGIPVTTPARTLADLAGCVTQGFLASLVDGSLRRGLAHLDELRAVYDELDGRVRGLRALGTVLEARQPGYEPGESLGELQLAALLVDAGLPEPVRQFQVVAGGTVYLLDLAYPDHRLGLEYDGWDVHRTRSAFEHDRARDNALRSQGWTILRYTNGMSRERFVDAVRAVVGDNNRHRPGRRVPVGVTR